MGDYSPKFAGGDPPITLKASADIVGGQLVMISGPSTVAPATAKTPKWIGVAGHNAKAGEEVTVHKGGVQRPAASGAITAGDLVVCAAAGQVQSLAVVTTPTPADVTDTRARVGLAVSTVANAGDIVLVAFER